MRLFKRQTPRRQRQGPRSTVARQVRHYQPADDALGLEIQAVLKTDKARGGHLRWCEPTPDGPEFDCYCAVSAGGYFFLKGEELASLGPLAPAETVDWEAAGAAAYKAGYRSFCSYGGGHWWLEHRQDGSRSEIIDLNIGLTDANDRFPYVKEGHGQKFQGPGYKRPSRRALELIALVKETRGRRVASASLM